MVTQTQARINNQAPVNPDPNALNKFKVVTVWDLLEYLMVENHIQGYDEDRIYVLNGATPIQVDTDDEVTSEEQYLVVNNVSYPMAGFKDVFDHCGEETTQEEYYFGEHLAEVEEEEESEDEFEDYEGYSSMI